MKRNVRQIFDAIANLGSTLDAALTRAAADGAEYGANGIEVERRRAATVWKRAAIAFLGSTKAEIEALREHAAADSRGLLEAIRNGRGPGAGVRQSLADETTMGRESVAQIRASEAAAASMTTVAGQLALGNRLAIAQLETTAELRERLKQYLADAEHGTEFDYEYFSIDARILPLILRRRADGGDLLADHACTENYIGRVETALLRRGGPELCDDADLQLFERVRAAIETLDPSTLRGLTDVQEVLSLVGRLVGLKVVEVGPRELPAPRHRSQATTNPDWVLGKPAA